MIRAVLAVLLVAAASSAASAGTYLGLGIGTTADVGTSNTTSTPFEQGGGRSERFILGQSFGRLSIEGAGTRYGLLHQRSPYDGTSMAIAAKLTFPLDSHFGVFGRGGVQRTWLSNSDSSANTMSYAGNGWLLGAGFEYHFDAALLGGGALFVDYERANSTFSGETGRPFDSSASMWTLGLTLTL